MYKVILIMQANLTCIAIDYCVVFLLSSLVVIKMLKKDK